MDGASLRRVPQLPGDGDRSNLTALHHAASCVALLQTWERSGSFRNMSHVGSRHTSKQARHFRRNLPAKAEPSAPDWAKQQQRLSRYAREQKQHVVSIVNVATSTIARESDAVMPTLAGPEIGVASTKAFTCQLTVLTCLPIAAGRARGVLDEEDETNLVCHITHTTSRDLSRKTRQPSEDAYRKSIVSPCSPIIRLEPCEKLRARAGAPMCRGMRNAPEELSTMSLSANGV
jgi:hypothetical protein